MVRVLREVTAGEGDYWARLMPSDEFRLSFNIAFANPLLAEQSTHFHKALNSFEDDLSSARTFCLYEEIEGMWAAGLAKGGSLENAVVVKGDQVMNPRACATKMKASATRRWTPLATYTPLVI